MPNRNPAATSTSNAGDWEARPDEDEWYTFDSSRVYEAAYHRASGRLYVKFERPTPGHDEYIYEDVPPNEWKNFKRSASPGKFVNRILNGHNYHRLNT